MLTTQAAFQREMDRLKVGFKGQKENVQGLESFPSMVYDNY